MKFSIASFFSAILVVAALSLSPGTANAWFWPNPDGGSLRYRSSSSSLSARSSSIRSSMSSSSSSISSPSWPVSVPPVMNTEHFRGRKKARVTAITYVDYECPFCRIFHANMNKLIAQNPWKIRWIFRHYPLSFHQNAMPAAEAAECAASLNGEKGFWKFTDAIMNGKGNFDFDAIALDLGIDRAALSACQRAHTFQAAILKQQEKGTAAGVQGTPSTFFINTKGEMEVFPGAQPLEQMQQMLDKMFYGNSFPDIPQP